MNMALITAVFNDSEWSEERDDKIEAIFTKHGGDFVYRETMYNFADWDSNERIIGFDVPQHRVEMLKRELQEAGCRLNPRGTLPPFV